MKRCLHLVLVLATIPSSGLAQMQDHEHRQQPIPKHAEHEGHEAEHHAFPAMLGPYEGTRDASGTSWQPASAGHEAWHAASGAWSLMLHGLVMPVWDHQGGGRGDEDVFASSMIMGRAVRALGPGRLGLRGMVSLDPALVGREGYPLLLQTGETSDGVTPLIDRQHPHDLFAELGASYSISGRRHSLFAYGALPGEPPLGPPVYLHRRSGMDIPEAPISHHWLDSSHITFGVVTLGGTLRDWKLEGSAFRGREPDHERWNIEEPRLDSHSFRLSWNPSPDWALQASFGQLKSPEELEPEVDVDRTTASAIYNRAFSGSTSQTTLAWGRNRNRPGRILDAFLLESALTHAVRHTFMGRAEVVEKDELFEEGDPLSGRTFTVAKAGLGYLYDPFVRAHLAAGVGVYGTAAFVPDDLAAAYSPTPLSILLFLRARIR